MNATDIDKAGSRNSLVSYSIQSLMDFEYVRIDATSGNITLAQSLFLKTDRITLKFRVQAYDHGTPVLATTRDVTLTVLRFKLPSTCDDIVNTSVSSLQLSTSDLGPTRNQTAHL